MGIPREKTTQTSALINLSRNLGGSVGISVVVTLLSRYGQEHQNVLSAHTDSLSPAYRHTIDAMVAMLVRHGADLNLALHQAQTQVYASLQAQATMLAFMDNFRLLATIFLMISPLALLMRRPNTPK